MTAKNIIKIFKNILNSAGQRLIVINGIQNKKFLFI